MASLAQSSYADEQSQEALAVALKLQPKHIYFLHKAILEQQDQRFNRWISSWNAAAAKFAFEQFGNRAKEWALHWQFKWPALLERVRLIYVAVCRVCHVSVALYLIWLLELQ